MSECASCGRLMPDSGPLCQPEAADLAGQLRAVPELLADLQLTLSRQDRLSSNRGSRRSNDTPVPWKEQVPDAVWALGNTVTVWARELADQRHLTLTTRSLWRHPRRDWSDPIGPMRPVLPDPMTSLRFTAGWLADHVGQLRTIDDAVSAADEITDSVAHARRVVDRPADRRFVGPCGAVLEDETDPHGEDDEPLTCRCDLYVTPGAVTAVCPGCGNEVPVEERREWLLSVVHDELATYTEVSRALSFLVDAPLPPSTVRTWVSRGQLPIARYLHRRAGAQPIVVNERQAPTDQPMVRVGHVIELLASGGRGVAQGDTPQPAAGS